MKGVTIKMAKSIKETKGQLSNEMKSFVDNYSNKIVQIKEFVEAVRLRPGMYIGPLGGPGFLNMIREVFQNAMDQMVSVTSPCNLVSITYDMREPATVTISDNGLGIPFQDIVRIYTEQHVSKNYTKEIGDYSAGLNGIGAKATNALSEWFTVESYHYSGKAKRVEFKRGVVTKEKDIPNKDGRQGTIVSFSPDKSIMGDTYLESSILYLLIRDMLSLTAIGNKVDYTSIAPNGKMYHELMVNEDGILTNLYGKCPTRLIDPIIIGTDTGTMKIDAAFTFDAENIDGENITAYANMCPTSTEPRNTHVKGFLDGICSWFVKHMNTIWLSEKAKTKVTANDVRTGLSAIISAFHLEPEFTGQAKEVFSNKDYEVFAKATVIAGLDEWSRSKPAELQKVCKYLKDIADARMKADAEKIKVTAKYNKNVTTGLPAKYNKPTGPVSLGWELIIVEGDSAGGTAKDGRDEKRQGIFPIRGKILNVFDATPDKIANNVEVIAIRDILGAGFGKTFDINKVKFQKIIFMADADADGAHISSLLLLVFLKFFPGLIESGRVYKAVPPLYGIRKKKDMIYFTERIDYAKHTQKVFFQSHNVTEMNGKPLTAARFANLLVEYEDYVYYMTEIANRYKIDPELLEMLVESYVRKDSFKKLQKQISSAYRFLFEENIVKIGNTVKIKGLVGDNVQTIFYNDKFIKDCEHIIPYVKSAIVGTQTHFKMDGERISLYQLVKSAQESNAEGVYRFKGLGEMNGDDLSEAVLHPESNRMLVRYTTENIKEDIQIIRSLESDKKKILAHIEKVNRIDLLG